MRRRSPTAIVVLLLCSSACAAEKKLEKTPWGGSSTADTGAASPAHANLRAGWSADQIAEAFPDPRRCERAARAHYKGDPDLAWDVLRICVERYRFGYLLRLLEEPWLPDLRRQPETLRVVGRVLAMRAAELRTDLQQIAEKDVPVLGLQGASTGSSRTIGRHVLVRGRLVKVKGESNRRFAFTLEETARISERSFEQVWVRGEMVEVPRDTEMPMPTGLLAWVRADGSLPLQVSETELMMLCKLEGHERIKRPGLAEWEPRALLTVLEAWPIQEGGPLVE